MISLRFGIVFLVGLSLLSSCGTGSSSTGSTPPATTVSGHSPTPMAPLTPTNSTGLTLTMNDNGRQVLLKKGQTLLLALDTVAYDHWTVFVADQTILAPVAHGTLPANTQGLYQAMKAGQTILKAVGDLKCSKANPPCDMHPRPFQVQVTVQ